ncbi:HotDog domain-containing protein [Hyaloraphidium curvatum]|nr:HotDog domain-containing protein [Hyaloraphidium curvatum]KAI9001865.1 HotDog domain-containing protein [Hyaloraphidium curvatum]
MSTVTIDLASLPRSTSAIAWNRRDTILYNIGIGCSELNYSPFPINIQFKGTSVDVTDFVELVKQSAVVIPGIKQNFRGQLAGDLTLEFLAPLPVAEANATLERRVTGVWDGGKHLITDSESLLKDGNGKPLFRQLGCGFSLGGGGWGGPKRPIDPLDALPALSGAPHKTVELQTNLNQAMIFRLTGDFNPHHVDPVVTKKNGYDKPILHGPCTIGFACRAVVYAFCDGVARRLRMVHCRFASPVIPGDLLRTELWDASDSGLPLAEEKKKEGQKLVRFRVMVGDRVVVSNGVAAISA